VRLRNPQAGFSLAEMLIVIAFIGIAVGIGIPLVNEQVRIAEVRSSADDLALHLRAARMIAVAKHKTIVFTVSADPTNTFSYEGNDGQTKTITMPNRVKIATGSDGSISFFQNGAVDAVSAVILESQVSNKLERWTATVNTVGLTTLAHVRI
jgi:prepilin-type N-terminal cleavage/methylation domain-containing protein